MQEPQLMQIDGHTLAALSYNSDIDSTPLVFIHGFTTNIAYWARSQVPAIDERFRWYSLSLPGHYPAAFPEGFTDAELTPDLFARLLVPAIQELVGTQSVILVGHSTGGFAALLIAEAAPEMVKGIICIGGFVNGDWSGMSGRMQKQVMRGALGRAMVKVQLRMIGLHPRLLRSSLKYYVADLDAVSAWPELDASIADLFVYTRRLSTDAMISYLTQMPSISISDRLSGIATPTLVLTGERDLAYPRDESALVHEGLPNSQLVVLEGVGHLPMIEEPQEYQEAITTWLAEVVG